MTIKKVILKLVILHFTCAGNYLLRFVFFSSYLFQFSMVIWTSCVCANILIDTAAATTCATFKVLKVFVAGAAAITASQHTDLLPPDCRVLLRARLLLFFLFLKRSNVRKNPFKLQCNNEVVCCTGKTLRRSSLFSVQLAHKVAQYMWTLIIPVFLMIHRFLEQLSRQKFFKCENFEVLNKLLCSFNSFGRL